MGYPGGSFDTGNAIKLEKTFECSKVSFSAQTEMTVTFLDAGPEEPVAGLDHGK